MWAFLWSLFVIWYLCLSGVWQGLKWRIEKPKRHMLWRDWIMCWKCRHHPRFDNQHNWEGLYNNSKSKRLSPLKPNNLHILTSNFETWNKFFGDLRLLHDDILSPSIQQPYYFVELKVPTIGPYTLFYHPYRVIRKVTQRGMKPWVWSLFEKTFY